MHPAHMRAELQRSAGGLRRRKKSKGELEATRRTRALASESLKGLPERELEVSLRRCWLPAMPVAVPFAGAPFSWRVLARSV